MAQAGYPRDLRGYGRDPPDPRWPGGARVAVQFVVNFEGGGENSILRGDRASEAFLRRNGRAAVAGTTPRQYRVDVRIRLARRLLAAMADFHRTQAADDGIWCCDRVETKSASCRGHEGSRLGHWQPPA